MSLANLIKQVDTEFKTDVVVIRNIIDAKPVEKNGNVYPQLMLITNIGNIFCFTNTVKNRQEDCGIGGMEATIVYKETEYKDKEGKDQKGFNVSSVTLHVQDTMIKKIVSAGGKFSM